LQAGGGFFSRDVLGRKEAPEEEEGHLERQGTLHAGDGGGAHENTPHTHAHAPGYAGGGAAAAHFCRGDR